MPTKPAHPRDVPCPTCGEPADSPCRLRSGKPILDVHCTDRITNAAGVPPATTPTPPYIPGEAAPAQRSAPPATPPTDPSKRGASSRAEPSKPEAAAVSTEPPNHEADSPKTRCRRKDAPKPDPRLMPALF